MTKTPHHKLIKCLTDATHQVSQGDYGQINTIFSLTREGEYPEDIVALAEAFGMMVVKVEASQERLERLVVDLQNRKIELEQALSQLMVSNIGMIEVLGSAIAKRDSDTNSHNYRVTNYAIRLGKKIGLHDDQLRCLIKGAFLHDVGKIGINDAILLKPGKLTDREFEIMKTHVTHGNDIIRSYQWLHDAGEIILHHHEKYDGSGYPDGLRGDQIPLNARVFAIVDVFDALTSKRPYKEPLPFERTMEIMAAEAGIHFDPGLFSAFGEIAQDLFQELQGGDEAALEERLHALMRDYYGAGQLSVATLAPAGAATA